jgi:hypothetical protein
VAARSNRRTAARALSFSTAVPLDSLRRCPLAKLPARDAMPIASWALRFSLQWNILHRQRLTNVLSVACPDGGLACCRGDRSFGNEYHRTFKLGLRRRVSSHRSVPMAERTDHTTGIERPQDIHSHTNRLAKEESPYLLQHQHNPVIFIKINQATVFAGSCVLQVGTAGSYPDYVFLTGRLPLLIRMLSIGSSLSLNIVLVTYCLIIGTGPSAGRIAGKARRGISASDTLHRNCGVPNGPQP